MTGQIQKAADRPGTHWARPWKLMLWTGFALVEAGRYVTERRARAAARRRGVKLPVKTRLEVL